MNSKEAALRTEVKHLAEAAFHRQLISGYGDGADMSKFQLVCQGKARHFPLERARSLLRQWLQEDDVN